MFIILIVILGLCLGSFVNALVWRLHEQSKHVKNRGDLSIMHGRSMCVHCGHSLAWNDLLPVVSWLSLRGRCRYCKKLISIQYPIVEIATALLFCISYIKWPVDTQNTALSVGLFIFWSIFLTGFMALAVYDIKWMLLPNKLVYPLLGLAVGQVIFETIVTKDVAVVIGAVAGLLTVGGLFYVLFQVSDGTWIGGGDVKLGFLIGLLVGGFIEGLLLIFIASLLGTLAALPYLRDKKGLKKRIPFGPFLILATIIVYLFAPSFISSFTLYFG